MSKSSGCECGHSESDHANVKCKYPKCQCLEFKIEEKNQEKNELKLEGGSKIEFEINAKMFKEFHGAGKKAKKTINRSARYDAVEKHWTNIGGAEASDHKLKIHEATEILKEDFTDVDAWIEKGINLRRLGKAAEAIPCFENALLLDKKNTTALLYQG